MGIFENLKNAITGGAVMAPQTPDKTAFDDEQFSDETALGLVLQDADIAVKYLSSKSLPALWNNIDDLLRAFVQPKTWPGSTETRAHLGVPLVLEIIETSLLPQIHQAFFSDKTPFLLGAQGATKPETAQAAAKILKWAVKRSGFKEETRKAEKGCLNYGTGVAQWGWEQGEEEKKNYVKEGKNVVSETTAKRYSRPTFEFVELKNLLVDPSLRTPDIRDARYVVRQKFITANELDDLRDDPKYKNVPTREELRQLLAPASQGATESLQATKPETWREYQAQLQSKDSSSDPLQNPLEILEYWTAERVIVVLQRVVVIRNDENEYERIPFVSAPFIDTLGSFYGFGVSALLGGEQSLQTGVMNLWLDAANLTLNPAFVEESGTAGSSQNIQIGPGKVIKGTGKIAPLAVQSVTNEAMQILQSSESRARRRVGGNSGPDMPNQAMRTAEGVQEFTAGIQTRTQYFVELFADLFFVPVLEAFLAMAKENMTPDDIDCVLTEEEGQTWDGEHLDFYNGMYGIEVLSSTKLAAKRAMVSLIPTLMQLFSAAPIQQALVVQNKKIDLAEFLEQVIDLTGWDANGLIVAMTPDDQQRAMQLNPAVQKAQSEMMLQQQQHQNDLELENAKGDVRSGLIVTKHAMESSEPEAPLATRPAK